MRENFGFCFFLHKIPYRIQRNLALIIYQQYLNKILLIKV